MKNALTTLIVFLLLLSACKKDPAPSPTAQRDMPKEVTQAINMLDNAAHDFAFLLDSLNGDTLNAFFGAAQAIYLDKDVSNVEAVSHDLVWVTYKSGLKVGFNWAIDSNGVSVARGGNGNQGAIVKAFYKTSATDKVIENKSVMLFSPATDLYPNDDELKTNIQGYSNEFTVDIFEHEEANLGALAKMKDYGLVILNTHGLEGGFMFGNDIEEFNVPHNSNRDALAVAKFKEMLEDSKEYQPISNGLKDGTINVMMRLSLDKETGFSVAKTYLFVSYQYVRNLASLDDDAVVFLNFCYSGHQTDGGLTNNLPEAFHSIGAKSVYAYAYTDGSSRPVSDEFANEMADSLTRNLIKEGDTTGIAHLAGNFAIQIEPDYADLRSLLFSGSPNYHHVFPNLYTGEDEAIDRINNKGYLQRLDYTFDIPKVNRDLNFYQYFDEGYTFESCGSFVDARDGQEYKMACIGDQVWMAQNLNYAGGGGVCYDNSTSNCDTYGRLYSILEATALNVSTSTTNVQGICPQGWHIPSQDEFNELITFCGGLTQAAEKLRSKNGWPSPYSDAFGFDLKPSGYSASGNGNEIFRNLGTGAILWTSSFNAGEYVTLSANDPTISFNQFGYQQDPLYKFSCRCIQD